jgi:hypothetical protein
MEAGDRFEVIELVQAGRGDAGSEEEYIAEEDRNEEQQGGEPQDSPPAEDQDSQEDTPEQAPQDSQPEEQPPEEQDSQEPPTEQEIRERAFYAAQADVEQKGESDNMVSIGCTVVFDQPFYDEYIKKIGNNLYQCSIDFSTPNCQNSEGGTMNRWLYLVRYDSTENKMYIPFKKNWYELQYRAYNQAVNYVENSYKASGDCDEIIFRNQSYQTSSIRLEREIIWDTFTVVVGFECHKGGNVSNREQQVRLRYEITNDSFTDFSYVSGGSI